MSTTTYTKSGNKASSQTKLNKTIFDLKVSNFELIKQAYLTSLANSRTNNAITLKRGEVRGGGRKPWKQKGTGRARFGSIRNPIWRGGGVTFGPSGNENYSKKINTASKRTAIKQALSIANGSKKINVIESFEPKEGRTKEVVSILDKLSLQRKVLLVIAEKNPAITRSTSNIKDLTVVQAKYLTVVDILNADSILFTKEALEVIDGWLGDKND